MDENTMNVRGDLSELPRRSAVKLLATSVAIALTSQTSGAPADPNQPQNLAGGRAAYPAGRVSGRRKTGPSVFKSRAAADYQQSFAAFGGRLTNPISGLCTVQSRSVPWQFDILIVGSGYGASTAAARLAQRKRPGVRVAMLERGREWVPGTFPDRLSDVLKESRLQLLGPRKGRVHKATGLFNVQQFEEITVLSGSGLGGSSLINASVAIRPDCDVFHQTDWPTCLQSRQALEPYYGLAEYELSAATEPLDWSLKMTASRLAGERLMCRGAQWQAAQVTVTRSGSQPALSPPIINRQGVLQRGCIDCGDCLSGCNVGAKNTLAMNYLALAKRAGVEMYTGVEVQFVSKLDGYYQIHYLLHREQPDGEIVTCPGSTTAGMLVLGAGSLGSTEILLRSQFHGMSFSPRLGASWTGNGDALGFVRKTEQVTGVGGHSAYEAKRLPVGPTIQTNLTYPSRALRDRVLIQDGAVPRAYANALGILMRNLKLDHTQIMLGMGHDGAEGRIQLNDQGSAVVSWPGLLDSRYRQMIRHEFRKVAEAMGGRYEYLRIFGDQMISVHPLGGCGMSDSLECGVVSDRGEVYDAATGSFHHNLYVIDGAMLPTSIGCNPLLTITALAERASDRIANDSRLSHLFVPEVDDTA
jgi:cholesterol oxidase